MFNLIRSKNAVRPARGRAALAGAVLLLTSALALVGCSSAAAPGATGGSGSATGTLRVSAQTGQPYLQDAANEFKRLNPKVTVQLVQAPSNTYQTTIRAQLAANHSPDVMFVWGGSGNSMATKTLAEAKELVDLSKQSWVKKMPEVANSLVTSDKKVYALNSYQNPTGVAYNTDLLKKLKVSVPTKFSSLLTFCKAVSGKGIIPIALGNQTGYLNTVVPIELANTLVYSANPNFAADINSKKTTWSGSTLWKQSLTKALKQYMQMKDADCFEPNSTGYSDAQATALVASGKALGVDVISPAMDDIKKGNPSIKLDMFSLPATEKASDTRLTVNTGAAYAVAADSKNKAAAIKFVNFMAQDDQLAKASKANFGVPYAPTKTTKMPSEMKGSRPVLRREDGALAHQLLAGLRGQADDDRGGSEPHTRQADGRRSGRGDGESAGWRLEPLMTTWLTPEPASGVSPRPFEEEDHWLSAQVHP